MDVKTKFNVGDTIFTYDSLEGKLIEFKVFLITVCKSVDFTNIYYSDGKKDYKEHVCFKSKNEFIESL